jgi:hypothetical protein
MLCYWPCFEKERKGCHAFMHIEGERRKLHYDNRHGRHEINTRK